jgi:hypothetical protein
MQLERNQKILVSKDTAIDATTLAGLTEGELGVLKPDGTLLTAGETISDAPYIYIVQGLASGAKFSQKIVGANVVNWTGKSYAVAAQQVSYIGSNGTNGAISPVSNSTEYTLYVIFKQDKEAFSERQLRRSFSYTSDASATQAEIVAAFVALINADSICKNYVTAASVNNGGDYGIRLTGKAQTYNPYNGYEIVSFEVALGDGFTNATRIDENGYVLLNGATPTTSTATSKSPYQGVGTYELLSDLERFALGNSGITNRTKFPIPTGASAIYAESTEKYDMYVIDHNNVHSSADLGKETSEPMQTIIAVPYDAAAGTGAELEALLNPWMASCPRAFANINL